MKRFLRKLKPALFLLTGSLMATACAAENPGADLYSHMSSADFSLSYNRSIISSNNF